MICCTTRTSDLYHSKSARDGCLSIEVRKRSQNASLRKLLHGVPSSVQDAYKLSGQTKPQSTVAAHKLAGAALHLQQEQVPLEGRA